MKILISDYGMVRPTMWKTLQNVVEIHVEGIFQRRMFPKAHMNFRLEFNRKQRGIFISLSKTSFQKWVWDDGKTILISVFLSFSHWIITIWLVLEARYNDELYQ